MTPLNGEDIVFYNLESTEIVNFVATHGANANDPLWVEKVTNFVEKKNATSKKILTEWSLKTNLHLLSMLKKLIPRGYDELVNDHFQNTHKKAWTQAMSQKIQALHSIQNQQSYTKTNPAEPEPKDVYFALKQYFQLPKHYSMKTSSQSYLLGLLNVFWTFNNWENLDDIASDDCFKVLCEDKTKPGDSLSKLCTKIGCLFSMTLFDEYCWSTKVMKLSNRTLVNWHDKLKSTSGTIQDVFELFALAQDWPTMVMMLWIGFINNLKDYVAANGNVLNHIMWKNSRTKVQARKLIRQAHVVIPLWAGIALMFGCKFGINVFKCVPEDNGGPRICTWWISPYLETFDIINQIDGLGPLLVKICDKLGIRNAPNVAYAEDIHALYAAIHKILEKHCIGASSLFGPLNRNARIKFDKVKDNLPFDPS